MLVSKGWSKEGASAATGMMQIESAFSPNAQVIDRNGKPSIGMVQWNGERGEQLKRFSAERGLQWNTVKAQVEYVDWEARNTERSAGSKMIGASDMESAILGAAAYERFVGYKSGENGVFTGGAWENANGNRAGQGLAVYNECFGGNVQSIGGVRAGGSDGFNLDPTTAQQQQDEPAKGTSDAVPGSGDPRPPYSELKNDPGSIDRGMKLSPNFTLGKLCPTSNIRVGMNRTGSGNMPHTEIIANLSAVAMNVAERLHQQFGKVTINSGYRSYSYNKSIGGATNSDHMKGQAIDVMIQGVPPWKVANWIERNIKGIAGIGRYPNFTHISWVKEGNGGRIRRW
jgi:hypothetical protein